MKTQALLKALDAARRIGDEESQAKFLTAVVPYLAGQRKSDGIRTAIRLARTFRGQKPRIEILEAIGPHLTESLMREALELATTMWHQEPLSEALAAVVPYLPEELVGKALHATRFLSDKSSLAGALTAIAPHLPGSLKPDAFRQALDAAREVAWPDSRARYLAAIAPHLRPPACDEVWGEALEAAWKAEALTELIPQLAEPLRTEACQKALVYVRDEPLKGVQAISLAALVPLLPESMLSEALRIARNNDHPPSRAEAMTALVPRLPEPLKSHVINEALDASRQIDGRIAYQPDRSRILVALLPHLFEPQRTKELSDALEAARKVEHEATRARSLIAFGPYLPDWLLNETLDSVLVVKNCDFVPWDLANLQSRLCRAPIGRLHSILDRILHFLASRTREDFLKGLSGIVPTIHFIGGDAAVTETAQAVLDAGQSWP